MSTCVLGSLRRGEGRFNNVVHSVPSSALGGPVYAEQGRSLWADSTDVCEIGLAAPPLSPKQLKWHPDARFTFHGSIPFSEAFVDLTAPGQLTGIASIKVKHLFWEAHVWVQGELIIYLANLIDSRVRHLA